MMDMKSIIQEAIAKCNPPTRYRLAIRLGVSPASVYTWLRERNSSHPTGKHLLEIMNLKQEEPRRSARAKALALCFVAAACIGAEAQKSAEATENNAERGIHIIRNGKQRLNVKATRKAYARTLAAMAF